MRPLPLPTTAYLTAGLATLSHVYSSQGEPLPRGRARRKSLLPLRGRAPPCSPGRGPRSDLTLSGSLCEGNAFPLSSHGWARVLVVDTFRPPGGGRAAPRAACLLWVPSTYQCPPSSRARPPASGGSAGGGRAEGVPHSAFWWPRIRPPCPVSESGRPRGLPRGGTPHHTDTLGWLTCAHSPPAAGAVVLDVTCFAEAERLYMLVRDTAVHGRPLTALVLPEVLVSGHWGLGRATASTAGSSNAQVSAAHAQVTQVGDLARGHWPGDLVDSRPALALCPWVTGPGWTPLPSRPRIPAWSLWPAGGAP